MAGTNQEIIMNFKNAIRQAQRLEEVAAKMESLAERRLSASLQQLSAGWKGENADAYLRKGDKLRLEISGTAKDLRVIAGDIRNIAQRIYNAEMAALRKAQERSY